MLKSVILVAALLVLPVSLSTQNFSQFTVDKDMFQSQNYGIRVPSDITGKVLQTSPQYYSYDNKCGRDQVIEFGSRHLSTNLWGAPARENITLNENCVFRNAGTFGWQWNRMDPVAVAGETNTFPIYPSVATGTDPWGGYSTNSKLPVRITNISSFILDVRYRYSILPSSSDSVNLAYDIWLTDTDKPGPGTTRNEVMIWMNRLNVPMPEDKRLEDVSDGYNTYTQYAYENYHAFILNVAPESGIKYHKANPKKLIEYLVAKGELSGDLWISRIDFGNEVWKGKGKIEVFNLDMRINNLII